MAGLQLLCRRIEGELAGRGLLEHPHADEMAQHALQRVRIDTRLSSEILNTIHSRRDAIGDPQGRHDPQTPWCGKITESRDVHHLTLRHCLPLLSPRVCS